MSAKITFKSEPARNQDTGCIVPFDWHVTLLVNGEPLISRDRSETSEKRFSETTREAAWSLAWSARYNLEHPELHAVLDNIIGGFEAIQWVR